MKPQTKSGYIEYKISDISDAQVNNSLKLTGKVVSSRIFKSFQFLILSDNSSTIQIKIEKKDTPNFPIKIECEQIVHCYGSLIKREEQYINPNSAYGNYEIILHKIKIKKVNAKNYKKEKPSILDVKVSDMIRLKKFDFESEASKLLDVEIEGNAKLFIEVDKRENLSAFEKLYSVFPKFAMNQKHAEYIFNLFPKQKLKYEKLSLAKLFQFSWSIFGNDNVKLIMAKDEYKQIVAMMVDDRVITEYNQLKYIYPNTLLNYIQLKNILISKYDKKTLYNFQKVLTDTLANAPVEFSNILESLKNIVNSDNNFDLSILDINFIHDALSNNMTTPIFFAFYTKNKGSRESIHKFKNTLFQYAHHLHMNSEIDAVDLIEKVIKKSGSNIDSLKINDNDFLAEYIRYIFNPVNMDIVTIKEEMVKLSDRTNDIKTQGILGGGDNWSSKDKCYIFDINKNNHIRLYFSKNVASYFSKSSTGICTAGEIDLYNNPIHFHINMVDEKMKNVGNIQAYVLNQNNNRALLLRAINPNEDYINPNIGAKIFEHICETAIQIAKSSNIKSVLLSESLGILHAQSSRIEIQTILEKIYREVKPTYFDKPFYIYSYKGIGIYLNKCYCVWNSIS
ncbi:MAG: OB-fold nucleic acid binding domain-containing protein [Patescibacteria group bacterium]